MADYFTGGGAGMDVQAGTDGLQTLYLMNPNFVGYTDAAAAATNMTLLNSAVSSLTPASFGHQPTPVAQHFVGIPLHPPPSGYNLRAPATTGGGGADMSPRQQAPGTSAVSAVLSLSSLEAPPVTVTAVPGTEGKYRGASPTPSQEHAVMSFKYLKVAQELLDEAVSVRKGVEEANAAAAVANSAMAMKKKEDSEGGSGRRRRCGGWWSGGGSKSSAAAEMSTAERQDLQVKKSKLVNMLDELEQRYRQYHHQMQAVASSFEAVAGAGSARTYTALALRTISRQFRCLQDAIAAQVRSASRALGEDAEAVAGGRTVGSRLRSIDQQLRKQLGVMQGGAWRPQRGLPERSVSVLRAWLFEHFLHPYPRDSDKIMLAKQTGLTRSQVSNWFINARVRLWKPMVEEMYLEETKNKDANAAAGAGDENSGGGSKMSNNTDSTEPPNSVDNSMSSSAGATSKAARVVGIGSSKADVHTSLVELAGDQQAQATFYGRDDGSGASFQHKLKKARTDKPAAFHFTDVATLQAQAAAAARHDEAVSHRELLMKFVEAGGSGATAGARSQQDDDDVGGYSLFTPAPYGQFGSEQYAFAGYSGGVSLTLGLPHGATVAEQTTPLVMSSSNASDGIAAVTAGYGMNMQSTKSFAAQLMRDFVA